MYLEVSIRVKYEFALCPLFRIRVFNIKRFDVASKCCLLCSFESLLKSFGVSCVVSKYETFAIAWFVCIIAKLLTFKNLAIDCTLS